MPFQIVRNDITKMNVDAIVNAANPELQVGGGVCGAIFMAAGVRELQEECNRLGSIETGEAVITKGYALPAKFIIHTAGPVWYGGSQNEEKLLRSSYWNSLQLASAHGLKSIAFPLISAGIYGYPKRDAIDVAVRTIESFLKNTESDNDLDVYLVVFDKAGFLIGKQLRSDVDSFIDENFVEESESTPAAKPQAEDKSTTALHYKEKLQIPQSYDGLSASQPIEITELPSRRPEIEPLVQPAERPKTENRKQSARSLEDVIGQIDETFPERLLRLIREKDLDEVAIYKKANIDRKLFSKIINIKGYNTSKKTIIAFAIAMELGLDDTNDLLAAAGYTLSHSSRFDLIIEYCINNNQYNIFDINEVLFDFEQPLLGA